MVTPSPASLFAAVVAALDPQRLTTDAGPYEPGIRNACSLIRAAVVFLAPPRRAKADEHHDALALTPERVTGVELERMRVWWAACRDEALEQEARCAANRRAERPEHNPDEVRGAADVRQAAGRTLDSDRIEKLIAERGEARAAVATWEGKCRGLEASITEARGHLEALAPSDDVYVAQRLVIGALAALSSAPAPTVEPAVDLDAIEARARAATPGPWEPNGDDWRASGEPALICAGNNVVAVIRFEGTDEDAAHIAGMDPPTTLRLCAELRRLRGERPRGEMGVTAREDAGR